MNSPTRKKVIVSLLCMFITLGLSCSEDDKDVNPTPDTTAPVITLINPALQGATAGVGQTLNISAKFNDNIKLSQAKINFHYNDGHSHKALPLDTSIILNLVSTEETKNISIPIGENVAAGIYHLEIECLDASGNKAEVVVTEIEITSPKQPVFSNLKLNGEMLEEHGAEIKLTGKTEVKALITGKITAQALSRITIARYEDEGHSHKTGAMTFKQVIELDNVPNYDLNFEMPFKTDEFETGEHHFKLYIAAEDVSGHSKVKIFTLHVNK